MATPISFFRVTQAMSAATLLSRLNQTSNKLLDLEEQISAQRRVLKPSDDPVSAAEGMLAASQMARTKQFQENRARAVSRLEQMDQQISLLTDILLAARTTAQEAVNPTVNRVALATGIDESLERSVSLANFFDGSQYIFGGSKSTVEPFRVVDSFVLYQGNDAEVKTEVEPGEEVVFNLAGSKAFAANAPAVRGTVDVNPIAREATELAALNRGRGVALGSVLIEVGAVGNTTPRQIVVDLREAKTVGDVLAKINSAPDNQVSGRVPPTYVMASLQNGRLRIEANEENFAARAQDYLLSIRDVGGGRAAADLGFGADATAQNVAIVDPALVGSFDVNVGATTATISKAAGEKGADVVKRVRAAAIGGAAIVDLSGGAPPAGSSFRLSLNGGTQVTINGATLDEIETDVRNSSLGSQVEVFKDAAANRLSIFKAGGPGVGDVVTIANVSGYGALTTGAAPKALAEAVDDKNVVVRAAQGGLFGTEVDLSNAAGTIQTTPGGNLFSTDLDPAVTMATKLTDLRDGSGNVYGAANFDFSGLRISNGDNVAQVSLAALNTAVDPRAQPTVENLVNLINMSGTFVQARINDAATGFDIVSRLSGARLNVDNASLPGSRTATLLGVELNFQNRALDSLNNGRGVPVGNGPDFEIVTHDRSLYPVGEGAPPGNENYRIAIDLGEPPEGAARTVGDVLNLINRDSAANQFIGDASLQNAFKTFTGDANATLTGTFAAAKLNAAGDGFLVEDRTDLVQLNPNRVDGDTVTVTVGGVQTATLTYNGAGAADFANAAQLITAINANAALNGGQQRVFAVATADPNIIRLVSPVGVLTTSGNAVRQPVDGQFDEESFRIDRANDGFSPEDLGLAQNVGGQSIIIGPSLNPSGERGGNVFTALAVLRDALRNNDVIALAEAQKQLRESYDKLLEVREFVGQRSRSLGAKAALDDDFSGAVARLKARLGHAVGLDFSRAAMEFQQLQNVFQAGLSVAAKVSQISLFDFI
ncbi:MAG: flagellar hook-associated protein FlgL [Planctomycetes bacterium]|nr:flagellar hook-associated protein FlgL [Planctomycetota bacterium]